MAGSTINPDAGRDTSRKTPVRYDDHTIQNKLPVRTKKGTLKPIVKTGQDKQKSVNAKTSPALRLALVSFAEASNQNAFAIPINKTVQTKPIIPPAGKWFGPSVKEALPPSQPICAISPLTMIVALTKTVTHIIQFLRFLSKFIFSIHYLKLL